MTLNKKSIPSDDRRCMNTDAGGRRCRYPRLEGHSLCGAHYMQAARRAEKLEPFPALVAHEILPPDASLDSAPAVNAALTRVFRCVLEGRLSPRHATGLGYVGQLIIATLPGLERAAANRPEHPLLGRDPDAALANLIHSLSANIEPHSDAKPEKARAAAASGDAPLASNADEN
jgi:hypothetical protein